MTSVLNDTSMIVQTERGLSIVGTRITLYDILDALKAAYPPKFIQDAFDLTDAQISAALAYIDLYPALVSVEYQEMQASALEIRAYWEDFNHDRLAQMAVNPRTDHAAARAKLQERQAQRAARSQ